MTTPDITKLIARADHLVRPFLGEHDTWRHDPAGMPLINDMLGALSRVMNTAWPHVRLDLSWNDGEVVIGRRDAREDHMAFSLEEAVLALLVDELERTCAICREIDGHDHACPVLALELDDEEERSARAAEEVGAA